MVEIANVKFEDVVVAVLPYLIPLSGTLFLIAYVPQLTLFLPNLLMGVK
jgi:TRAP-type C4-dicarboxylate transport system permease large subunit